MKTGYFAKLKEYEEAGYTPVSISRFKPPFFKGLEYKKVAPSADLLHAYKYGKYKNDFAGYITKYMDGIAQMKATEVVKELEELTKVKEDRIILLCYEKPDNYCHRHYLASWLRTFGDIECKEYDYDK